MSLSVADSAAESKTRRSRLRVPTLGGGLLVLLGALVVTVFLSVALGSRSISPLDVLNAFTHLDRSVSTDGTVTLEMRVPRTLLGILVGAALGASGAILQGVTRNPLADPGIMGVNAGAAAAIVVAIALFDLHGVSGYLWFAFGGAIGATLLVYAVASLGRGGASPLKLALAGAAVTAALTSLTSAVLMTDDVVLDEMRFWQVGSLAGRYLPIFYSVAPFLLVGLAASLLCGWALNGLALGDDTARALGLRVGQVRVLMFAVVAVLCGAATAACGPIVFVGLVAPHLARLICGPDYRWILPYSMLLSPLLLLLCDILGRLLISPGELQVGVVLGVLGAPFFIALVRYGRLAEL
ncbi:FecCD family ABC transporter permease [Nocardioides speluncae]|uniref:FecCD family ABC transporter permease n=1 Tax=Nocardioides speluncae TaxID=2670337 RepID=UPI000D68A845|nr:iron ABC transporter permease [Nocardioides speluncae]